MNIHLHLPFNGLKTFNISLAGERKQQKLAKEITKENMTGEMVPFSFTEEGGKGTGFTETPFVLVSDITKAVTDTLTKHYTYRS